jgi:hypothetical protein
MSKNLISLFTLGILFTSKVSFSQCAMCKAVVENGDVSMAEGVNNGITYLMVFPYLLIGVLFYVIYRNKKNVKN